MTIRGLGVIEAASLEFSEGFTVVTGETGAGKTMVVNSLTMLMGARANSGRVRSGLSRADVEGVFGVKRSSTVGSRVLEAGGELDDIDRASGASASGDAELIVARSVSAAGRSRAFVGGRSVPIVVLEQITADLLTVHGQNDQILLKSPTRQRKALDSAIGKKALAALQKYQEIHSRHVDVVERIAELETTRLERVQEADYLRQALQDIEKVDPQPSEDNTLTAEFAKLSNVETLRSAVTDAVVALTGDSDETSDTSNVLLLIDRACRALDSVIIQDDSLAEYVTRVKEVSYALADIGADLTSYLSNLEADPNRLQHIMSRRDELASLTRRYGQSIDEVLEWSQQKSERLTDLDTGDDQLHELHQKREQLHIDLVSSAEKLTQIRQAGAHKLSKAVTKELTELSMPDAQITIDVKPAGEFAKHGADTVTFLLTPHQGADPQPIAKTASGGELSRVMLALEVVLAGKETASTYVFDEVDAGVGGKAAEQVGRRLAMLAKNSQVIVVTHLPQVAAFADHHLVVSKSTGGHVTVSDVKAVADDDRVLELARMLAGQDDSEAARDHARELLEAARLSR